MKQQKTDLITVGIPENLEGGLQIFDIKQLADMEAAYRKNCKQAVNEYKLWVDRYKGETDMIDLLYGNLEGSMLRRQAEDTVSAYWIIRKDFRRWYHRYMAQTKCYPSNNN